MVLLNAHTQIPAQGAPVRAPAELLAALGPGDTAAARRAAVLELALYSGTAHELGEHLATESMPSVREAIVTALVAIGTEEAARALAVHLQSDDVALRNDAIAGLRQIGAAATPEVERLINSADPDLRIFAINAVEGLPYAHAAELLRPILRRDDDVNVGLAAVEAIVQIGGPDDVPALLAFATRFLDEPFVAFAVAAACTRLVPAQRDE
jgi:HEAT repeat protein